MNAMFKKIGLWVLYVVIAIGALVGAGFGGHYLLKPKAEPVATIDPPKPATEPAKPADTTVHSTAGVKAGSKDINVEASSVATVEGACKAVEVGADVSVGLEQGGKASDEDGSKKCSSSVYQRINIRGGDSANKFEGGEADKKRADGAAKLTEVRAKYAARMASFKPEPAKVDLTVHSDVSGTVKVEGHVDASGTVTHTGSVVHSGTVHHEGEIVSKGTITVEGVTKTVTIRERYDRCGNLIARTIE